jgi:hypothetical protein
VGDQLPRFECELKVLGHLRSPFLERLDLWRLIESVLDLDAFEHLGILVLIDPKSARTDLNIHTAELMSKRYAERLYRFARHMLV